MLVVGATGSAMIRITPSIGIGEDELEEHAGHDAAVIGDETAVLIQFDFDGDTAARIGLDDDHGHV